MGNIVVTEFMSLDGVVEDPGGGEDYNTAAGGSRSPRRRGRQVKLDEAIAPTRCCSAAGPTRALRRRGRSATATSRTSSTPCRSTSSPRPCATRVDELDRDRRRPGHGDRRHQGPARRRHRRPRQPAAGPGATRAGPGRRGAADGLPGRARPRQAAVRRQCGQEVAAPDGFEHGRRRRRHPRLRPVH